MIIKKKFLYSVDFILEFWKNEYSLSRHSIPVTSSGQRFVDLISLYISSESRVWITKGWFNLKPSWGAAGTRKCWALWRTLLCGRSHGTSVHSCGILLDSLHCKNYHLYLWSEWDTLSWGLQTSIDVLASRFICHSCWNRGLSHMSKNQARICFSVKVIASTLFCCSGYPMLIEFKVHFRLYNLSFKVLL